MAIIICGECKKDVSSNAHNCPNCGNVINLSGTDKAAKIGFKMLKIWVIFIFIGIPILVALAFILPFMFR